MMSRPASSTDVERLYLVFLSACPILLFFVYLQAWECFVPTWMPGSVVHQKYGMYVHGSIIYWRAHTVSNKRHRHQQQQQQQQQYQQQHYQQRNIILNKLLGYKYIIYNIVTPISTSCNLSIGTYSYYGIIFCASMMLHLQYCNCVMSVGVWHV